MSYHCVVSSSLGDIVVPCWLMLYCHWVTSDVMSLLGSIVVLSLGDIAALPNARLHVLVQQMVGC